MKKVLMWAGLSIVALILWWAAMEPSEGAVGGTVTVTPGATPGAGSGSAIMDLAGKGTNLTVFGSTNYFANDAPGNTNGPLVLYRQAVGSYNDLFANYVIGTSTRMRMWWGQAVGQADYGEIFINTVHSGTPPSGPNTEWQFDCPGNYAFGPGFGSVLSGHIQKGIWSFGGYGAHNYWEYWQTTISPMTQSTATNFSGASAWKTSELQGANQVDHFPGIYAYSIRTNAPGRYALEVTMDTGVSGIELWDPLTAKPQRVVDFQGGDVTNALFYKPINYATNLGSAVIDCSLPVSDVSQAGGTLTFTAPINFDSQALQYEHVVQIITNSAAGTLTLAPPANGRLSGTTTLVRQGQVEWWIKIGKYTNGVITLWF